MVVGMLPRALASSLPTAVAATVQGGRRHQLAQLHRPSAIAQLLPSSVSWLGWRGGHLKPSSIHRCGCSPWVRKEAALSSGVEAATLFRAMAEDAGKGSFIVVYVTVPDSATGSKLAGSIISNRLAACVNQVPGVQSTYWWEGKVTTDSEELLIVKTQQYLLGALTAHVKANHPYSVPEVIALPILGGSPEYLKWLVESTEKPNAEIQ